MHDKHVYPLPRPEAGDDPRFTFGLAYDVGIAHGYPPITIGPDHLRLSQALFNLIYQQRKTS